MGVEKFYYPTLDIKRKLYKADPPQSIYKDLPKKFRFKLQEHVDENLGVKKLEDKRVWKLVAKLRSQITRLRGLSSHG